MRSTAAATSAYSFGRSTPATRRFSTTMRPSTTTVSTSDAWPLNSTRFETRSWIGCEWGILQVDDDQVGQRPGALTPELTLRVQPMARAPFTVASFSAS